MLIWFQCCVEGLSMKTNYNCALVTKSNDLVEASYKLSTNEQKIILMLTASLRMEDEEFRSFSISVRELNNILGLKHQNTYQDIRKLVLGLQKKTLSIYKDNLIVDVNWLAAAKYHLDKGMVELRFDEDLKGYLLGLKDRFTSYPFNEVIQFKSQFTFRIFELLKQYEKIKVRTLPLEELRAMLRIEPEQYQPYANLKNRVLLSAQSELEEKSRLIFDFEEIKEGRKVVKIKFLIKTQAIKVEQLSFSSLRDIEEADIISDFDKLIALVPVSYQKHLTISKLLKSYIDKKGFDYVVRNIEYANAKSHATTPEKGVSKRSSYRGYLAKSLQNDFGLAYQEDQIIKKEKEDLQKEHKQLKEKLEVEKNKKIAADKAVIKLAEKQKELAKKHIELLSSEQLQELEVEAINNMEQGVKTIVTNKKTGWKTNLQLKMNEVIRKRLFSE